MTEIDQFESVFKAADKLRFSFEGTDIRTILVVTDLGDAASEASVNRIRRFLNVLGSSGDWATFSGNQYSTVAELMEYVNRLEPDLICTFRNLHTPAAEHPYSLGIYLDILTQVSPAPVMVFPRPEVNDAFHHLENTQRVMAITDHLTGDHHLVNTAVLMTQPTGTLFLTHVEDEATFERYAQTISKIPGINTEMATESIRNQLLKEPADYIESCRDEIGRQRRPIHVETIVTLGHRLSDYKQIVKQHEIDLLVLNTKDDDQLAMHGQAYPLSVELRNRPLLLL